MQSQRKGLKSNLQPKLKRSVITGIFYDILASARTWVNASPLVASMIPNSASPRSRQQGKEGRCPVLAPPMTAVAAVETLAWLGRRPSQYSRAARGVRRGTANSWCCRFVRLKTKLYVQPPAETICAGNQRNIPAYTTRTSHRHFGSCRLWLTWHQGPWTHFRMMSHPRG